MSFEIMVAFVVFGIMFAIVFIGFAVSARASSRNNASTRTGASTYNPGDLPRDSQRIVR